MLLSVIIPTKDREEIFTETLSHLISAIEDLDAEIIVVNDSKISVPHVPDLNNLTLVNNPKSGVASARNLGALVARGSLLIFMDDDFIVSNVAVKKAIQLASSFPSQLHLFNWNYPQVLLDQASQSQFGRYLIFAGFTSLKGWLGSEWNEEQSVFELKDGASYFLTIARDKFEELKGYNETFPHAGAEDYDFVQRAKRIGLRFYLNKECTIFHNEKDRLRLTNWLVRKRRTGETLRVAVDEGHQDVALRYNRAKIFWLSILSDNKAMLFILLKTIPNVRLFDWIYFKLINVQLAIHLFEGYTGRRREK